jgi:hypothetical protein
VALPASGQNQTSKSRSTKNKSTTLSFQYHTRPECAIIVTSSRFARYYVHCLQQKYLFTICSSHQYSPHCRAAHTVQPGIVLQQDNHKQDSHIAFHRDYCIPKLVTLRWRILTWYAVGRPRVMISRRLVEKKLELVDSSTPEVAAGHRTLMV